MHGRNGDVFTIVNGRYSTGDIINPRVIIQEYDTKDLGRLNYIYWDFSASYGRQSGPGYFESIELWKGNRGIGAFPGGRFGGGDPSFNFPCMTSNSPQRHDDYGFQKRFKNYKWEWDHDDYVDTLDFVKLLVRPKNDPGWHGC
jgi:hypothetical protein